VKAAIYEEFGKLAEVRDVPDPAPADGGVVIRVEASGICRSDWHGWMGHDNDITLPHVPGHEMAGVVEAVGKNVTRWREGDRVTLPFCCGCGDCPTCHEGNLHICDQMFQPGFTHWGSFARYCAIDYADHNLVRLPIGVGFVTAASLGCRFVTSYRAIVDQGRVAKGEWVAIHGCGGVGLSAIMIAKARGARVVGIDIGDKALELARLVGAESTINALECDDVPAAVREVTRRGAHVSLDALGSPATCRNSILSLRKRGRHVQVGLLLADESEPALPMYPVLSRELEIVGSHGMPASHYSRVIEMIVGGRLDPRALVDRTVTLEEAPAELMGMGNFAGAGIAVIDSF
jgi:alcohol dehydrogenase